MFTFCTCHCLFKTVFYQFLHIYMQVISNKIRGSNYQFVCLFWILHQFLCPQSRLPLSIFPSDFFFKFVMKVEKWGYLCPMDTFLVNSITVIYRKEENHPR